jgi:K+-sensing histidine kinase KdpD
LTPPGKNIYAYVSLDGENVRCEVIDEGSGLSKSEAMDLLNNIPGRGSHVGREESIGIGLTVANSLAKILGGELRCESMLGKGSTFILELPTN